MFNSSYLHNRALEAQSHLEHLARAGDFNCQLHYNLAEAHVLQFETSPERTLRANAFRNAASSAHSLISTLPALRGSAATEAQRRELDELEQKFQTVRKQSADYFSVHRSKNAKTVFEAVSGFLGVENVLPERPGQVRSLFGGGRVAVGWKDEKRPAGTGVAGQQVLQQPPSGQVAMVPVFPPAVGPTPLAVYPFPGQVMAPPTGAPAQSMAMQPMAMQPMAMQPMTTPVPVGGTPVGGTPPLGMTAAPALVVNEVPVAAKPESIQTTAPAAPVEEMAATQMATPVNYSTPNVPESGFAVTNAAESQRTDARTGNVGEDGSKRDADGIGPEVPTIMPSPPRDVEQNEKAIDRRVPAI